MTPNPIVATWSQLRRKAAEWGHGLNAEALSQRMERKQRLVEHGADFAERGLQDFEARVTLALCSLRAQIAQDLATHLDGSETEADVEHLVDTLLDDRLRTC